MPSALDRGDIAWMLVATALVLFMTIPGLALFYGGLVRTKNVLSVLMQCLTLTALVTLLWLAFGYSLAFDPTGMEAGVRNVHSVMGTGMLWVGWLGFNGGSALAANGNAAMAIVATQVSASAAALTWMAIEWWGDVGRPSVLGVATGAVAGLAAVTPASGFVGPVGALAIGTASGALCWFAASRLKRRLGYDDSLDVFGVHGVGGFIGTVLAGVFAAPYFGGNQAELVIGSQVLIQLLGASAAVLYTALVSFGILRAVALFVPLRVEDEHEAQGIDVSQHGETGYNP